MARRLRSNAAEPIVDQRPEGVMVRASRLWWGSIVSVTVLTAPAPQVSSASGVADSQARRNPEHAAMMRSHFDEVTRIHEAVVRGDLEAARAPARALASYSAYDELPPEGRRFVSGLAMTAARVSTASDVVSAASATASMLVTCGDCHRAMGRTPSPAAVSSRRDLGGVVGHMLEHDAAVEDMFRGLVIPSATAWREGAVRLRTAPLRRGALPPDRKLTRAIVALEKRVHETAARAVTADSQTGRATAYAELIAQCAGCHSLHPNVWGPHGR
jgi:mono/diheme cytochrome c family protein